MMKFLFDLFPVLLFFLSYNRAQQNPEQAHQLANQILGGFTSGSSIALQMAPIIIATAIAVIASVAQIAYLLLRRKKVDAMLWVSFSIVTVFGGLTIYLQNDTFVKLKVTIIYWLFASGFLFSHYVLKKNFLKISMGKEITMPDQAWTSLNFIWIGYFALMGAANLYVALTYSQATWVSYKFYSLFSLPVFLIAQSFLLVKYIKDEE